MYSGRIVKSPSGKERHHEMVGKGHYQNHPSGKRRIMSPSQIDLLIEKLRQEVSYDTWVTPESKVYPEDDEFSAWELGYKAALEDVKKLIKEATKR